MISSNIYILIISIHFRYISRIFKKNKKYCNLALKYKGVRCMVNSPYTYQMLPGAILEFYNLMTMYLTHNIHKEFLFLLHVNDGDRCGSFGNTVIE